MSDAASIGSPTGRDAIKLLFDVTHEFSSTLDLPLVLGKVLSLTVQSLGATRGSLFLLDDRGRAVRHILARQHLPPEVREQVVATVMDKGLAGWVYRHGKAAIVNDTNTDPRWHVFADDHRAVHSVLAAPLGRRGVVSGIITLEHPETHVFTRADLQLLIAIAHQAAIAIENARLFTHISGERDTVAAILNGVRDAILVTSGDGHRLVIVNPAGAALFDAPPAQILGWPLAKLGPPDHLLELFNAVTADQPQEAEIDFNGQRTYHVNVQEIPKVGRVAALHDVTHFKQLDNVKSEFVSSVSHDLKNPLGTILGYAWLLDDDPDLTTAQRDYVTSIMDAVERMQSLVENLLDLAKIEAGIDVDQEPCQAAEIVAEVVQLFAEQVRAKEIELATAVQPNLPLFAANRLRITQALENLVSNAIKYTPAGGRVTLRAGAADESITFSVADTGLGIAPKDHAKVFEKFTRVGGEEALQVAGTGLGLAIVRSVVEAHGGRVWLESDLGKGSTFFMRLPFASKR